MFESMTGGCLCGAVRYRISAPPMLALHCCCHACQRASGGAYTSLILVAKAAVTLEGELRDFDRIADSGNTISRGFCPVCGSPVASRTSGYPESLLVRAGSLDDPALFKPLMVIFRAEAPPWARLDPDLPAFAARPSPQDIQAIMHGGR